MQDHAPELAERRYKEALRAQPGNVYALFNLAFLYIRQGREEATEAFNRVLRLDSEPIPLIIGFR